MAVIWPSKHELIVLKLLVGSAGRELYGLELVKQSGGDLKRGSVYVILGRMVDKGFLSSRQEDAAAEFVGIKRRLYKVTGLGQSALRAVEQGEAHMSMALPVPT